MNLPRSVSDVLAEHVTFEVECIDRTCELAMPDEACQAGREKEVSDTLMKRTLTAGLRSLDPPAVSPAR